MRRKKEIDEWALNYWLLQRYAKLCFRISYRNIEFINLENIPRNQPVLIAPNHQNALMDAMAFVTQTPFQHVFLARADIFKGKRLTSFLTYLNIMPIFRIRDGIENVKKNDAVFDKTTKVLHNRHNPLVIYPEGNHGDHRRLRPLVKGLFRIAFQAQENFGASPAVKIVPVGIDYGHYQHFRTTLLMQAGEPIEIGDFYNDYNSNPVAAINQLKDLYIERLRKLVIDIQTKEFYDLYMSMREIFNDNMRSILNIQGTSLYDKFRADKVMIDILDRELQSGIDEIRALDKMVADYRQALKNADLRDHIIKKKPDNLLVSILKSSLFIALSPVFLFGFINNYLPYWFTGTRVKNLKDPQFHSSFKYVVGMIAFPVWYLIIAGILGIFSVPFWLIILYLVLLPVTGVFAFDYFIWFKKFRASLRFSFLRNKTKMKSLVLSRKKIIEKMTDIINRNKSII